MYGWICILESFTCIAFMLFNSAQSKWQSAAPLWITYHAVNNNAILLAHVINKSHKDGLNDVFTRAQFEVALNLYNGSRILLEKHRGRLPHQLRCHEIPRPNAAAKSGELVIDLSNITLCRSRYCQDCVAPGINAKEVDQRISVSADKNNRLQSDAEKEFNMNDQALLLTLSRVISLEGMKWPTLPIVIAHPISNNLKFHLYVDSTKKFMSQSNSIIIAHCSEHETQLFLDLQGASVIAWLKNAGDWSLVLWDIRHTMRDPSILLSEVS